jgi:hypothetical protein
VALCCWVQVHLYDLGDLAYRGRVLVPGDDAATALAFTPDGTQLAVATAGKAVHVFDIASRTPAAWAAANGASLQGSLDKVPGPILGLSFDPTPKVRPDAWPTLRRPADASGVGSLRGRCARAESCMPISLLDVLRLCS